MCEATSTSFHSGSTCYTTTTTTTTTTRILRLVIRALVASPLMQGIPLERHKWELRTIRSLQKIVWTPTCRTVLRKSQLTWRTVYLLCHAPPDSITISFSISGPVIRPPDIFHNKNPWFYSQLHHLSQPLCPGGHRSDWFLDLKKNWWIKKLW